MISDLVFERSSCFWLFLILIPIIYGFFSYLKKIKKTGALLGSSFYAPDKVANWIHGLSPVLIAFFLLMAFLGPKGNPHYSETEIKQKQMGFINVQGLQWIVVLDSSASMKAIDTPSRESRFESAKELADLLLRKASSSQVSFWVLGSEMIKMVPATQDKFFTRFIIKQTLIDEGGEGTDFLNAFQKLAESLKKATEPAIVILLTDGEDTVSLGLSGELKSKRGSEILSAAKFNEGSDKFPKATLLTVGFGTLQGSQIPGMTFKGNPVVSRLDKVLLEQMARQTQGHSFVFNDFEPAALVERIQDQIALSKTEMKLKQVSDTPDNLLWDLYFQVPLVLALLFFILFLTYPDTKKAAALFFYFSFQLFATDPNALNRQIQIYLEVGDMDKVEELLMQNSFVSSDNAWQKEAIIFNQAALGLTRQLLKDQANPDQKISPTEEDIKVGNRLNQIHISDKSSPWVLERWALLKAAAEFEEGTKSLYPSLLNLALYTLNEAQAQACAFEKEKGYQDCEPSFEVNELKTIIKSNLSVNAYETQEIHPSIRLAYVLEWIDKVKLTQQNPLYYDSFIQEMQGKKSETDQSTIRDALMNFKQKDYEESLQFLTKERESLVKEVLHEPLNQRIRLVLNLPSFSKYNIMALQDDKSESILKALAEGHLLESRFLLEERLVMANRVTFQDKTPVDVLQNGIDEGRGAHILRLIALKLNQASQKSIEPSFVAMESAVIPFVPVSFSWREKMFFEQGCEAIAWQQVIPHFTAGLKAVQSRDELVAIREWQQALKLLKSPPSKGQSPQAQEALSDSVRALQDMELADQDLSAPPMNAEKKVDRPW